MDGANAGHFIAESESEVAEPSNRSSVAQKLPPELLIEIFSLTTTPIRTNKLIDNYNAVVFLSQVCKDWRQVAHETPHLWTDLCIIIPDYPSDVIKTWLGHSAQRPLSITLSADGRHSDPAVINEILLVKSRLAHLEIIIPASRSEMAPLFEAPLEALQTFRLTKFEKQTTDFGGSVDLSVLAPSLRSLILSEDYTRFLFNIPWSQLVHLEYLVMPGGDGSFDILRKCPNLERLNIETYTWEEDHLDIPQLTLPNLLHFGVSLESMSTIGLSSPLFQPLLLPALTSLKIVFDNNKILWPQQEFLQLKKRSPNIQHIELCCITAEDGLTANKLIPVLRASPALKSLTLSSCTGCVDDTLLQALRYTESDPEPFVPLLESLSWDKIGHNFEESALEDMIRSRWRPAGDLPAAASSLKIALFGQVSVHCGSANPLSDSFITRMRDCFKDAISLS